MNKDEKLSFLMQFVKDDRDYALIEDFPRFIKYFDVYMKIFNFPLCLEDMKKCEFGFDIDEENPKKIYVSVSKNFCNCCGPDYIDTVYIDPYYLLNDLSIERIENDLNIKKNRHMVKHIKSCLSWNDSQIMSELGLSLQEINDFKYNNDNQVIIINVFNYLKYIRSKKDLINRKTLEESILNTPYINEKSEEVFVLDWIIDLEETINVDQWKLFYDEVQCQTELRKEHKKHLDLQNKWELSENQSLNEKIKLLSYKK